MKATWPPRAWAGTSMPCQAVAAVVGTVPTSDARSLRCRARSVGRHRLLPGCGACAIPGRRHSRRSPRRWAGTRPGPAGLSRGPTRPWSPTHGCRECLPPGTDPFRPSRTSAGRAPGPPAPGPWPWRRWRRLRSGSSRCGRAVPEYCRWTPADVVPFLRKSVSSTASTPSGQPSWSATYCCTSSRSASASQDAPLSRCWKRPVRGDLHTRPAASRSSAPPAPAGPARSPASATADPLARTDRPPARTPTPARQPTDRPHPPHHALNSEPNQLRQRLLTAVPVPQHDETSASGCQLTTPSPERRGRGSTRLPVRASSRCCRWVSPLLRFRTIRLVSAAFFEMHDEWIALPRRHLPEGDMGGICRKLCFGSSALPNAPKCSRQLIPSGMARDTTWRMRVPGRVALASAPSRAGHRRPFTQRLLGS